MCYFRKLSHIYIYICFVVIKLWYNPKGLRFSKLEILTIFFEHAGLASFEFSFRIGIRNGTIIFISLTFHVIRLALHHDIPGPRLHSLIEVFSYPNKTVKIQYFLVTFTWWSIGSPCLQQQQFSPFAVLYSWSCMAQRCSAAAWMMQAALMVENVLCFFWGTIQMYIRKQTHVYHIIVYLSIHGPWNKNERNFELPEPCNLSHLCSKHASPGKGTRG